MNKNRLHSSNALNQGWSVKIRQQEQVEVEPEHLMETIAGHMHFSTSHSAHFSHL